MPVPQQWSDLSQTPANNSPAGSETVGPLANDYFQAAYAFIRQLYDKGGLPNVPLNANSQKITNVANGVALTDAANLSQLNTTLGAPSGTRVVFQQATAPIGWVIDTSTNFADCAVRFNNTSLSSGGTTAWSAWNFGGTFSDNAHQLAVAEMPSHSHTDTGHTHGFQDVGHNHGLTDNGHNHGIPGYSFTSAAPGGGTPLSAPGYGVTGNTAVSGTGISIAASGSGIAQIYGSNANLTAAGGNAGHSHTYTTPQVKYADVVIGIKS